MLGSLNALFAATVLFVGGHFVLSSPPVRSFLVDRLGPRRFRALYSVLVTVAFVWMLFAYGAAPRTMLWYPAPALAWIAIAIMPFALILAVAGVTTRSPTAVGGDTQTDDFATSTQAPAPGILRITRHPFLWGTALWAASHLLVNGDAASVVMMGGILILSLAGMRHIDARREESLGAAWGPIALTTSVMPLAAILSGRAKFDWQGIGWVRLGAALLIYVVLLYLHPWLFGVSALPG
jgi:uncharacterized membrane protein